jgi:phosphatidylserine/phosphatidylglycerophosphate/cardiolipin synthase-like enzyme
VLSVFRCRDLEFVDALGVAIDRGVTVEALLAARPHRWRDEPDGLPGVLRRMGVCLHVRPAGAAPYHAKYLVADEGPAFVGTLNWTRRHFDRTCDFGVLTHDPAVARGLLELFELDRRGDLLDGEDACGARLLVAPERARDRFAALLAGAGASLEILDHKLRDPEMIELIADRRRRGCDVRVLDGSRLAPWRPHGRLLIVDGRVAVIGGTALSPIALDRRRELSLVVHEPAMVARLRAFFALAATGQLADLQAVGEAEA